MISTSVFFGKVKWFYERFIHKYDVTFKVNGNEYKTIKTRYGKNVVLPEESEIEDLIPENMFFIKWNDKGKDIRSDRIIDAIIKNYAVAYDVINNSHVYDEQNHSFDLKVWIKGVEQVEGADYTVQYRLNTTDEWQDEKPEFKEIGTWKDVYFKISVNGYDDPVIDTAEVVISENPTVYTVRFFYGENNTQIKTEQVAIYSYATAPTSEQVVREGYDFKEWNPDTYNHITSNLDVYAVYEKKTYTVTFKDDENHVIATKTVEYNETVESPSDEEMGSYKEKYNRVWNGTWDKSLTNITQDQIITAVYDLKTFKVEFKDYDGTSLQVSNDVEYGSNVIQPSNPEREGYDFKNWNPSNWNPITEDKEISAEYDIKKFQVLFWDYTHDSQIKLCNDVEWNTTINEYPEVPLCVGYYFDRWVPVAPITIIDNTEISGYYELSDMTFTWKNEDETTFTTTTCKYGQNATQPENTPTKEGWTFAGWNGDQTNITTNDRYATATFTENIKYYDVTFLCGDVEVKKLEHIQEGLNVYSEVPTVVKEGYTFIDWSNKSDLMNVQKDISSYAQFEINKYQVRVWKEEDEYNLISDITNVEYGTDIRNQIPENPISTGCVFNGWDIDTEKLSSVKQDYDIHGTWELSTLNIRFVNKYKPSEVITQTTCYYGQTPDPFGIDIGDFDKEGYVNRGFSDGVAIGYDPERLIYNNNFQEDTDINVDYRKELTVTFDSNN